MKSRALLSFLLLAACGQAEPPVQEPDKPVEEAAETTVSEPEPLSLYAQCAEARGFPLTPPLSGIAGSFFVRGQLIFHFAGGELAGGKTFDQQAELWLGGPSRLRFALSKNANTNLFLLADPKQSWVSARGEAYRENPPQVLTEECLIRWEVMRFPWGWEEVLTSAEANPDGSYTLQRLVDDKPLQLQLSAALLPAFASYGNARAELSDWRPAPASVSQYPHLWEWPNGEDLREEKLDLVVEQAFFLDSAFFPPAAEDSVLSQNQPELSPFSGSDLGDLSLLEGTLAYLTEEDASTFDDQAPRGAWWRQGETRFFLQAEQQLLLSDAPDGATLPTRQLAASAWLRWTTTAAINDEQALERLVAIAKQQKKEADGPLWALITERAEAPRVFLLPLRDETP